VAVTNLATVPVADTAYGQLAINDEVNVGEIVTEATTEEVVRSYFSDIPVLVQIARCESQFRHTLADGTILRGSVDPADTGVMQINKRYHAKKAVELGLNLDEIHGNMAYARYLYKTKGTSPWNASAPCWGRTIAMR